MFFSICAQRNPIIRHFSFLLIVMLFPTIMSCSSSELQVVNVHTPSPSKSSFVTETAALLPTKPVTSTLSSTSSPFPSATSTLSFPLPPECQKQNPNIDSQLYDLYDFQSIPCENLSNSADDSFVSYVTLVRSDSHSDEVVRAVMLFSNETSETIQIYESKCAFLYPEWTPTGHLVISDVPYDVGCGYTIIYSPLQKRIIASLDGEVRRSYQSYWSEDKRAFYVLGANVFGPTCSDNLSGFDLYSESKLPAISPITPNTNIYAIIGKPIWMPDDKTLLVTIRDGMCSQEVEFDCQYQNSYIVAYNFAGSKPKISRPFYDPAIDYSFRKTDHGIIEFKANAFEPLSCLDIARTGDT